MSNKKQSSVYFILNAFNLLSDSDFKAWMLNNHDEIKAMHKEEIEDAFENGVDDEYEYHINVEARIRKKAEKYYNETFGGQDNE